MTAASSRAAADLAALGALRADPRLAELERHVPPLSLPHAFGVARDEVAHSRVLATILNPSRHAGADLVLRDLLREVCQLLEHRPDDTAGHVSKALASVLGADFDRVAVRRESMLIDVVVEVSGPAREVVLGIENKIDAGEQPDQIARYQASLARAYPGRVAAVVFLTPTGRAPTTAEADSPVPVVALDYRWLAGALAEVRRVAAAGDPLAGRDGRVLRELEDHIRGEILAERDEGPRELVRALWREHGRALGLAIEHRPRLGDVREEMVSALGDRLPDARFEFYPERRSALREVKMNLRAWDRGGFPFTFMVRAEDGVRPYVRALIWKDSYRARAAHLERWARAVNKSLGNGPLVDAAFPKIRGWDWHKILPEEDYPTSAEISATAFDQETVSEATGAVVALVELLRPHVETYLRQAPDSPRPA